MMTQTLLEESKLLTRTNVFDESANAENLALIKSNSDGETKKTNRSPLKKFNSDSIPKSLESEDIFQVTNSNGDIGSITKNIDLSVDCKGGIEPLNSDHFHGTEEDDEESEEHKQTFKHLYPQVLVQGSHEFSDIDSDEEDFQLRRHRKNDSGQGSSVETSSLKSNPHDFYQVDISFDETLDCNSIEDSEALDHVLNDPDFSLNNIAQSHQRRHSSFTSRRTVDLSNEDSEIDFTDIPLNTPSPAKAVNTYTPSNEQQLLPSSQTPLKPPSVMDTPPKQGFLKRANQKSWKIFGKVAVPVEKEPSPSVSPNLLRKQKKETVGSSTTALIFENRPLHLPPKSAKEEQKHREQYENMIAFAKRKELKDKEVEKKKLKERQKLENQISNIVTRWKEDIIPNWHNCKSTRKVRDLWWAGVPPSVRGKVWSLAIGNDLNITKELFQIFSANARDRIRNQKNPEPVANLHDSESSLVVSKENTVGLITLDVSRTFPSLCIFQKGGPYHEPLKNLLAAYTCFRPDVGYVQGMSFLAAMFLLNLDTFDAFVAFANLLNRPCQMAFFMVDQPMMDAYYRTFDVLLEDQIPKLYTHMKKQCLSHDIYLIDWIFTLFSKSLPLDTACRVWDLFCRDGEEFLFRTALGILLMSEDVLLEMEFFRLAQYLTKLSNTITSDVLFKYIEKINFSKQKLTQTLSYYKQIARTNPPLPT
eukprot:TCONS_00047804-protein